MIVDAGHRIDADRPDLFLDRVAAFLAGGKPALGCRDFLQLPDMRTLSWFDTSAYTDCVNVVGQDTIFTIRFGDCKHRKEN